MIVIYTIYTQSKYDVIYIACTCIYIYIYIQYGYGMATIYTRDVPDTTLPDTGFNRIVIYRIPDIPDSSKLKHNSFKCLYTRFTNLKNRNIIR